MIRALLDTNVVLDFLLDRDPFASDAAIIWQATIERKLDIYISAITPINVFYIARKIKNAQLAREFVKSLLASCLVCRADHATLESALSLPLKDFEDAFQVASAQTEGVDFLVTRDPADYKNIDFPVISPAECVARLG